MVDQLTNVYLPGPQLIASNYVPGTVRTITVAGGNLFELALRYLGRAEDWNRIAALNGLWDPVLTGVVTLRIPPYDLAAGNGGILSGVTPRAYVPPAPIISAPPPTQVDITVPPPPITTAPPVSLTAPTITGTPTVGQVLTRVAGTYQGTPTPTLTYQWRNYGVNIAGATGTTYTVLAGDGAISVLETATNTAGTLTTSSATTYISSPTLNPSDKAASITLNTGNLGWSRSGGAETWGAVRAIRALPATGKWGWAVAPQATPVDFVCGICSAAQSMTESTNYFGQNANAFGYWASGYHVFNDSAPVFADSLAAYGNGTWVTFLYDADTGLTWVAAGSANWNGDVSANPTSGTGGKSIASMAALRYIFAAGKSGDAGLVNFGATTLPRALPSGFSIIPYT